MKISTEDIIVEYSAGLYTLSITVDEVESTVQCMGLTKEEMLKSLQESVDSKRNKETKDTK